MILRRLIATLCLAAVAELSAVELPPTSKAASDPWNLIEPFSKPPPEWAGDFGDLRSPLKFENGKAVQTASDWRRRRGEIKRQWNALMGPWPPVIAQPNWTVLKTEPRENFIQSRVRIQIALDQSTEGWFLRPAGAGPFPAVLVVFYEPETSIGLGKTPERDFALQLTRRGFATLSIGTPGGNAWKPELGSAQCQPLSFHAYVAANCWQALSKRPEIDPRRIGITGHSYGGKWALFSAALWDRFACVAVSDPGIIFDETRPNVNYWEPWYLGKDAVKTRRPGIPTDENPRTGAYGTMIETGRNLHELEALIAPRPFLLSGGVEDPPSRWPVLNHLIAVDEFLGFPQRVFFTHRETHSPNPESNRQLVAFFEHFLAPAKATPTAP